MKHLRLYQVLLLLALFGVWHVLTATEVLPSFFFGRPLVVLEKTWDWFASGKIYSHLWITLVETVLAFVLGTALGLAVGLWLALSPLFAVWFGLGIWSKVALGVTLVFFIVFFNVYQGVKEVSPVVLANARMLGANR